MSYEIDFLPVGDGERSGDAIALRYGDLHRGDQSVAVIDGGYTDDGEALMAHIERYYQTTRVDRVVNTHPDDNHIRGLIPLVQQFSVGELWMHLPWNHTSQAPSGLDLAGELRDAARSRGVPIREPFTGVSSPDGCLTVLGPTRAFYQQQLDEFDPSAVEAARLALSGSAAAVLRLVPDSFWHESLVGGKTTARNESSVISELAVDGNRVLLTGDAGIAALTEVLNRLEQQGFAPGSFDLVQLPHHGSRRNVSTEVLDRLLGPIGRSVHDAAIVSCAKDSDKHPSRRVTNAFRRRGYPVTATNGITICHHRGVPPRPGWTPVTPLPFFDEIEDEAA